MTTDLARAWYILIALSLAWSNGCRPPASQSSIYIDINRVPLELRDEYASFATNCSKCHGLSRALNANVTDPKHWDLYVARMMRTAGSAISPHEAPIILRFLHWYTVSYKDSGEVVGEPPEPVAPAEPSPAAPATPQPESGGAPPNPYAPNDSAKDAPQPTNDAPTQETTPAGGGQ